MWTIEKLVSRRLYKIRVTLKPAGSGDLDVAISIDTGESSARTSQRVSLLSAGQGLTTPWRYGIFSLRGQRRTQSVGPVLVSLVSSCEADRGVQIGLVIASTREAALAEPDAELGGDTGNSYGTSCHSSRSRNLPHTPGVTASVQANLQGKSNMPHICICKIVFRWLCGTHQHRRSRWNGTGFLAPISPLHGEGTAPSGGPQRLVRPPAAFLGFFVASWKMF